MNEIIKDAGFIEDTLKTMKDNLNFRAAPFKTMFAIFGPILVWQRSRILGAILFVMQELGYGPGKIGEWIDRYIGSGAGKKPELSDEKLRGAAETSIDKMLKELGMAATASIEELLIKESFEVHDIVTIAVSASNSKLKKEAIGAGRARMLQKFLGRTARGGRLPLIAGLYYVLKLFAKGLIGVGIAGGVVSAVKKKDIVEGPSKKLLPFESDPDIAYPRLERERMKGTPFGGKSDTYLNTRRDVEDTLIHFLDSAYKVKRKGDAEYLSFSDMFRERSGYPLRGSAEMSAILNMVRDMNLGDLNHIDMRKTFAAPDLEFIAKKLLPGIQMGGGKVKQELSKALRGL